MVYGAKVYIADFGDIFSLGTIHLSWLGYPFTIIAAIAAMNAFNMSDGIDGLVGVLSLTALAAISFLLLSGNSTLFLLPLLLGFSTIPYLFFNLGIAGGKAKKIFMGDAGSMFVGMSVAWLLVAGSQGESPAFRPIVALWIIAIPLMDMISLTVRRARSGKSPFAAGRDHLHHLFMDAGLCQKKTLIAITGLAILTIGAGLIMELSKVSESIMFFSFVLMLVAYFRLTGILRDFGQKRLLVY
jgi:UDP-GlcNAc:undecaprenyl-phosphate GlcNAc-1-phosphate transferase